MLRTFITVPMSARLFRLPESVVGHVHISLIHIAAFGVEPNGGEQQADHLNVLRLFAYSAAAVNNLRDNNVSTREPVRNGIDAN